MARLTPPLKVIALRGAKLQHAQTFQKDITALQLKYKQPRWRKNIHRKTAQSDVLLKQWSPAQNHESADLCCGGVVKI